MSFHFGPLQQQLRSTQYGLPECRQAFCHQCVLPLWDFGAALVAGRTPVLHAQVTGEVIVNRDLPYAGFRFSTSWEGQQPK